MKTLKRIAAVFLGLMLAFVVIILFEKVSHGQMVVPDGVDPNTPEGAAELIGNAPMSALMWVVGGYFFGTFLGALLAQFISNGAKPVSAWITGGILLVLTILNLYAVPHPLWMVASSIAVVIAATFLGGKIASRKKAKTAFD